MLREPLERLERGLQLQGLGFLDQRAHPVGLPALHAGIAHARDHVVAPRVGNQLGHHRRAARRQLVDDRDVEVGVEAHRQRARNRRRAHHQLMRLLALARSPFERSARRCCTPKRCCSSTIASPSSANVDLVLKQRVRADRDLRRAMR